MRRLIIIGNGFDLSLGIKTSYNHFLAHHLKEAVKGLYNNMNHPKHINNLGNTYQNPNDDLVVINIITGFATNSLIKEIETLKSYLDVYDLIKKNGRIKFKLEFLNYIVEENRNIHNWIDLETEYYDYLIKTYKENQTHGRAIQERSILSLHNDFDVLKKSFIQYLETLNFSYHNDKVKSNFFSTAQRFTNESDLDGEELDKIMLLCFNYTKSVDLLSPYINIDCDVNYIHGKLNDSDSIIFGFGDELDQDYKTLERERSQELFKNVKSVHYFKYSNYNRLHNFINSGDNFQVYIYGHSCGISDRTLLNEIFENESCVSIRLFYYKFPNGKDDNFHDISVGLIRQFEKKQWMRSIVKTKNKKDIIYQCQNDN